MMVMSQKYGNEFKTVGTLSFCNGSSRDNKKTRGEYRWIYGLKKKIIRKR